MYNGVGLQTAGGSGTSGYVQTNKFSLKPSTPNVAAGKGFDGHQRSGANEEMLEHDRKRQIELKLVVLEDKLVDYGFTNAEIAEKLVDARRDLESTAAKNVVSHAIGEKSHPYSLPSTTVCSPRSSPPDLQWTVSVSPLPSLFLMLAWTSAEAWLQNRVSTKRTKMAFVIGAFYWMDRSSTSVAVTSNNKKSHSLQNVWEAIVQETRKLMLVHPVLVFATKAAILGDKYSANEAKWSSSKWSSENTSNLGTSKSRPKTMPHREYMPSIWQSFVTHRVLVRASDDDKMNANCQVYSSEWLLPSLNLSDTFVVTDTGISVIT